MRNEDLRTKHLNSDSWNTDKSVCATEASSHAVAQTERRAHLSVQIVQDNFVQHLTPETTAVLHA